MEDQFSRTEMLIGKDALQKLKNSKVAIFGIGGVGSYVLEALARVGVGNFILIDNDIVDITNINRQIIATYSSVGKYKVEVARARVLDINKDAKVEIIKEFFNEESNFKLDSSIDYVIDAIDTISSKLEIIKSSNNLKIPMISCMGTGYKMDPTKFKITDIYKTSECPVAKIMRKKLKEINVKSLKVLYSTERKKDIKDTSKIASISFVPSVAGLIIASEVVKDIISASER